MWHATLPLLATVRNVYADTINLSSRHCNHSHIAHSCYRCVFWICFCTLCVDKIIVTMRPNIVAVNAHMRVLKQLKYNYNNCNNLEKCQTIWIGEQTAVCVCVRVSAACVDFCSTQLTTLDCRRCSSADALLPKRRRCVRSFCADHKFRHAAAI